MVVDIKVSCGVTLCMSRFLTIYNFSKMKVQVSVSIKYNLVLDSILIFWQQDKSFNFPQQGISPLTTSTPNVLILRRATQQRSPD